MSHINKTETNVKMETNSIIESNEDGLTIQRNFKEIKVEIKQEDDLPYDLTQNVDGNQSNENGTGMVYELPFVVNALPSENIFVEIPQGMSAIENNSIDTNSDGVASNDPESGQEYVNPVIESINSDIQPNDLSPKPKHICVTDKIRLCVKDSGSNGHNANFNTEYPQAMHSYGAECLETPINQIPKDVLGNYGIVIEEYECYAVEPAEIAESDHDSFEDDQRLVIDEETDVPKTEELSESELSAAKDEPAEPEMTDCGWGLSNPASHLVISSVISLHNKLCTKCDEVFPSSAALLNHQSKHCSFNGCPEIIERESDMKRHMQIHTDHPVKPFRCEICRKRFHYYRFAQKHREVCKLLKRSKCPYCKYSSSKIGQFNKHIAKHINNIICNICKKKYTLVKKFCKHMYLHHRKRVVFQCTECPRHFRVPDKMINHLSVHNLKITECGMSRFIQVKSIDQA